MPPLRHMNGQPIAFAAVTDYGQSARRAVYSSHLTPGGTRRNIFKLTTAGWGGVVGGWRWWVASIDPSAAPEYRDIVILGYLPEGPYDGTNRPDALSRRQP